ncbi:DUF6783 domain-containing protein [Oliverpabstia intestinalis]
MRVKYTAKWGLQIAEMIFQTRSSLKLLCPRSRTQAPKPCRRPLENQKRTTVFKTLHFENDSPFTKNNIRS